jgi:hypothetical protein
VPALQVAVEDLDAAAVSTVQTVGRGGGRELVLGKEVRVARVAKEEERERGCRRSLLMLIPQVEHPPL